LVGWWLFAAGWFGGGKWTMKRGNVVSFCLLLWGARWLGLQSFRSPGFAGLGRQRLPRRLYSQGLSQRRAKTQVEDPCTLLGLPPNTRDEAEVRAAFRQLAKIYHPDVPETGDVEKFHAIHDAASQLLGFAGAEAPDIGASLDSVMSWGMSSPLGHSYGARNAPSSAARPLEMDAYEGSRTASSKGERINIPDCVKRRRPDLKRTAKVSRITHEASIDTLERVQVVLSHFLGVPFDVCGPFTPLMNIGFMLEGSGNIGFQNVAEVTMALEATYGIQFMRVIVGTYVTMDLPEEVRTVQDLANFVESKIKAGPA